MKYNYKNELNFFYVWRIKKFLKKHTGYDYVKNLSFQLLFSYFSYQP